jgi:hypothetical protein
MILDLSGIEESRNRGIDECAIIEKRGNGPFIPAGRTDLYLWRVA